MSTTSVEINEWRSARAETLVSDNRLIIALHWLPDGRLIYALAGRGSSLWTVTLKQSGKVPEPPRRIATTGHGWISRITGSADGKALIFLRANSLPSIYGSAQEFVEACILSRFLKNDKFCFCDRHALRLKQ